MNQDQLPPTHAREARSRPEVGAPEENNELPRTGVVTPIGPYPEVQPRSVRVACEADVNERMSHVRSLASDSFAGAVNPELARLSGYYQACSDWLNYSLVAHALAKRLGVSDADYQSLLKEHRSITPQVYDSLRRLAEEKGMSEEEIRAATSEVSQINLSLIARQRMLLGRSILNSTPLIMRDPFAGGTAGTSYGFGDGKSSQIFEGKAEISGVRFSAIASPRVHRDKEAGKPGYVLRFAVCNTPREGYSEHNPAFILDNAIVDALEAWHAETAPGTPIETNPLLTSMSDVLNTSVHDWIHSWLLYDVNAKTPEFKQWGSDIFFEVPHLMENKLLINYEMMCLSIQRNTWAMMFAADPEVKEGRYRGLKNYLSEVDAFARWAEHHTGDGAAAAEQRDYLAYVVLSNIILVLDPHEEELSQILDAFPYARTQINRILGECADLLHADLAGVPSQAQGGDIEVTSHYVARYPLEFESAAHLRQDRHREIIGDPTKDDLARNFMAHVRAFEALPAAIKAQIGDNLRDPGTISMLSEALENLRLSLGETGQDAFNEVCRSVVLDESGRAFLRLDRNDIDYAAMDSRIQNKRVLLIEVPKGEVVEINAEMALSLNDRLKKQTTTASDRDVIAINVQEEAHAQRILEAARKEGGASIPEIMSAATKLGKFSAIPGASDIYPLRRERAEELYGFSQTGYYESLGQVRYVAKAMGPIVMELHDGSDQFTNDGILVYIPPRSGPSLTLDPSPDCHGIEKSTFTATHPGPESADAVRPFELRAGSRFCSPHPNQGSPQSVTRELHAFLGALSRINLKIDHGSYHDLARDLFPQ